MDKNRSNREKTKNKHLGQNKFDGEAQLEELQQEAARQGIEIWELEEQRRKEEDGEDGASQEEDDDLPSCPICGEHALKTENFSGFDVAGEMTTCAKCESKININLDHFRCEACKISYEKDCITDAK